MLLLLLLACRHCAGNSACIGCLLIEERPLWSTDSQSIGYPKLFVGFGVHEPCPLASDIYFRSGTAKSLGHDPLYHETLVPQAEKTLYRSFSNSNTSKHSVMPVSLTSSPHSLEALESREIAVQYRKLSKNRLRVWGLIRLQHGAKPQYSCLRRFHIMGFHGWFKIKLTPIPDTPNQIGLSHVWERQILAKVV